MPRVDDISTVNHVATRQIPHDQLAREVKGIYAGLVMAETVYIVRVQVEDVIVEV